MPSINKIVEQEINRQRDLYSGEHWKKKFGDDPGLWLFLNNFHLNFPNGYYRYIVTDLGEWDKNQKDSIIDEYNGNEIKAQEALNMHSPIYLGQTAREFFQTIDNTTSELNISVDQIKNLVYLHDKGDKDAKTRLDKLILPIYIRMREMGYYHQDLAG